MVSEDLILYHKFAEGFTTGSILQPYLSDKQKKFTGFGKTLIDTLGPLNGVYCVEVFERDNG